VVDLEEILKKMVVDEPGNATPYYGIIEANKDLFKVELGKIMGDVFYDLYLEHTDLGTQQENFDSKGRIEKWLGARRKLMRRIAALVHIMGGNVARSTEVNALCVRNRGGIKRNVFLYAKGGIFMFAPMYGKTRGLLQKDVPVYRFTDVKVSELVLGLMLANLIEVKLRTVLAVQHPNEFEFTHQQKQALRSYLFVDHGCHKISDRNYRSACNVFCSTELDVPLFFSDIRHLSVWIARRVTSDPMKQLEKDAEKALANQAGHSLATEQATYAVNQDRMESHVSRAQSDMMFFASMSMIEVIIGKDRLRERLPSFGPLQPKPDLIETLTARITESIAHSDLANNLGMQLGTNLTDVLKQVLAEEIGKLLPIQGLGEPGDGDEDGGPSGSGSEEDSDSDDGDEDGVRGHSSSEEDNDPGEGDFHHDSSGGDEDGDPGDGDEDGDPGHHGSESENQSLASDEPEDEQQLKTQWINTLQNVPGPHTFDMAGLETGGKVLYGRGFKWRCDEQKQALSHLCNHDNAKHLLAILGCGKGKSLLYELPFLVTSFSQTKHTIVLICPFVMLAEQAAHNAREVLVKASVNRTAAYRSVGIWRDIKRDGAQNAMTLNSMPALLIIGPEACDDKHLITLLQTAQQQDKLAMIVIDEVHTTILDIDY
ncbi:MAG: DEAD/DEAH box helicase, partial [Lentibacter algarum]